MTGYLIERNGKKYVRAIVNPINFHTDRPMTTYEVVGGIPHNLKIEELTGRVHFELIERDDKMVALIL